MKKIIIAPLLIAGLMPIYSSLAKEATILRVSKTLNSKNVLHYKVNYDEKTCEINGNVYADWKMDEEDGRWKSLKKSAGFIEKPLRPHSTIVSGSELIFETESMEELAQKRIIDQEQILVKTTLDEDGTCRISNEISIKGKTYHVTRLHSKVTFFGSVKWVEISGVDESGKQVKMRFK